MDLAGINPDTALLRTRGRASFTRSWALLRDVQVEQSDPERFYSHLGEDTAGLLASLLADAADSKSTPPDALPAEAAGLKSTPLPETATVSSTSAAAPPRSIAEGCHRSQTAGAARPSGRTNALINPSNPLGGKWVLDVGGGPGYFARAFRRRGARYVSVEPDAGEMATAGIEVAGSVRGSGTQLPFADSTFDVAYSSNVAEHIAQPWTMGEELLRVTKPGGVVVVSYTVWLGPFGGHETGLWAHYLGGNFARRRYRKKMGQEPKNRFGESLFAVSCADGIEWAQATAARGEADILGLFPRYHPRWAWWVSRVPVFREFATSNLVIALRRRA